MSGVPAVDGSIGEWSHRFVQVDERSVSAAALPTDSLLYVAVLIQDRDLIPSVAVHGLTVWVDPAGGTRRRYGVRYPLGLRRQRVGQTRTPTSGSAPQPRLDDVSLTELEVVRKDSIRRRIPAQFSSGLRASATLDPGALVSELAIPIGSVPDTAASSQSHGLRAQLGPTVGIGIEIPQPEEEVDLSPPEQGVAPVPGRTGRRRRRGRRRRQRRQQSESAPLPSLEVWTTITTKGRSQ